MFIYHVKTDSDSYKSASSLRKFLTKKKFFYFVNTHRCLKCTMFNSRSRSRFLDSWPPQTDETIKTRCTGVSEEQVTEKDRKSLRAPTGQVENYISGRNINNVYFWRRSCDL